MHARTVIVGAISAASLAAHAGGPVSWADPLDGVWGLATNWDPAVIPGASDNALLALKGSYTVSVAVNQSAGSLTIANPEAVLAINPGRTLSLFGPIANAGRIDINPANTAATTTISFIGPATLSGPGAVRLSGTSSRAQLTGADASAVITHGADHTIHGFGRISAPMVNDGLISADEPGQSLELVTHTKQNNAVMEAVNAGTLLVQSTTIDQSASGILLADGAGSILSLNGVVINGGAIAGSNGGLVEFISSSSTINAVTLEGLAEIVPGRTVTVQNNLTNNATLTINPNNSAATTTLTAPDAIGLDGSGQIILASGSTRAQISGGAGATVTHGQNHTIRGTGRINAALVNNGLIIADSGLGEMLLTSENKTNNNVMRATGDGALALSGFTLDQAPAAEVVSDGPDSPVTISTTTINGGAVRSVNGGLIQFTGNSTIDSVTLEGLAEIVPGRTVTVQNSLTNNATLTINPTNSAATTSFRWLDDTVVSGNGTIRLSGQSTRSTLSNAVGVPGGTLGSGIRLEGIGRIDIPLTIQGALAPGLSVGTIRATSPITLTETATLEIEVAGDNDSDRIDSSSGFHAAGTLDITFVDGFDPPLYWSTTIVNTGADGVSGRFDAVNAPAPGDARLGVRVQYRTNEIRVGAFCRADINFDGVRNFFDISDFIALYNAQDPAADIAAPFGVWNFFDIAEFIARYNDDCP